MPKLRTPSVIVFLALWAFPCVGIDLCRHDELSEGLYSRRVQLDSHRSWLDYDQRFTDRARAAIVAALPHYAQLKEQGHPHIKWMESVGFVLGPTAADVRVPSFGRLMVAINQGIDAHIAAGTVKADQVLRPARIFFRGDPKDRDFVEIEYGGLVPPGHTPVDTIIPFPATLRLMKSGVYPIGEVANVGPRHDEGMQIFPLHDLAHFSRFLQEPTYMAAMRDCAGKLSDQGVYYRAIPDIRTYRFTEEDVKKLIQLGALGPRAAELLPYTIGEVNRASGQEKLNYQALLVQSGNRPLNPRQAAAIRFNLLLEGADLLPEKAAKDLFMHLKMRKWLPTESSFQRYEDHRFKVSEVMPHLEKLPAQDFSQVAKQLFETYERNHQPWGGVIADGIQPIQRRDLQPQGFTYYYSLNYLYQRALTSYKKGPTDRAAAEDLAKFQVALLESGRFTIQDWARDVSSLDINRQSEVSRWLTETGAFPKDLYFSVYGGDLFAKP